MAYRTGTIHDVRGVDVLSQEIRNLCGTPGLGNWSFVEQIPAGTGLGTSGSSTYRLDVFECTHNHADASGLATLPYYVALEIPVANLSTTATAVDMRAFETYEGGTGMRFTRPVASFGSVTPVEEGWRTVTLAQYTQVLGAFSFRIGSLMSTGFTYRIKMTNSALHIGTTQGTAVVQRGFFLMESLVSRPDLVALDQVPLFGWNDLAPMHYASKLPGLGGVALGATSGGQFVMDTWTRGVSLGYTRLTDTAGDFWAGNVVYKDRAFIRHVRGSSTANKHLFGSTRGFLPNDFWLVPALSTEAGPGDTFVVAGDTWVVLGRDISTSPDNWLVTRVN